MVPGTSFPGSAGALRSPAARVAGRVLALGLAAYGIALVLVGLGERSGPPFLLDYRIYVGASANWVDGRSIYDFRDPWIGLGSTYPPIASVLFAPLTRVQLRPGEYLWTAVGLAALFAMAVVVCREHLHLPWSATWWWSTAAFGVAVVLRPAYTTLILGQINLVLWLLLLVDLFAVGRGRRWAGLATGLGTAVKLVPGVFVLLYLVARRWRAAAQAIGAAVAVTALAWLLAPEDSRRYWTSLLWDSSRVGPVGDEQNNSLRFMLAHTPLQERGQIVLWVLASAAVAAIGLWRAAGLLRRGEVLLAGLVTGCVGALCSPISWVHHLVFLPLVVLFLPRTRWRVLDAALVCGVLFLLWDPIGVGHSELTAWLRALLMLAIVLGAVGTADPRRRIVVPRPAPVLATIPAPWSGVPSTAAAGVADPPALDLAEGTVAGRSSEPGPRDRPVAAGADRPPGSGSEPFDIR